MANGDVRLEHEFLAIEATLKTITGVTKGQVLAYDTDGLAPITATSKGPFFVALETVAAPGAGQSKTRVLARGVVTIATTAAAVAALKRVMAGGAGIVKEYVDAIKVRTGSTAVADSVTGALLENAAGAEIAFRAMGTAIDTTYELGLQDGGPASIVGIALTGIGGAGGSIDVLLGF